VPAIKYSSVISQADANAKATKDITDSAQFYANANGLCVFFSIADSAYYVKAGCSTGIPDTVKFKATAGRDSSLISQADANAKAHAYVTANGQTYANTNGGCTFWNLAHTQEYTKACATGMHGTTRSYTIAANKLSSRVSQIDAENKAIAEMNILGQAQANDNGICEYWNAALSPSIQKSCRSFQGIGTYVTYNVPAGTYKSTVSQAETDTLAQRDVRLNGQTYANANGTCECTAEGKKRIGINCETGTRVNDTTLAQPNGTYKCTYHYLFSDGTSSGSYSDFNPSPCPVL
jgi:hypothetical protein